MAAPTSTPPPAATAESLKAEQPKIDAALKSFCSWLVAQTSVQQQQQQPPQTPPLEQQQQQQDEDDATVHWDSSTALICTRCLSKAINAHVLAMQRPSMSSDAATQEAREVLERTWNQYAADPSQRITKCFGRTALSQAWSSDLRHEAITLFLQQPSAAKNEDDDEASRRRSMDQYLDVFGQILRDPDHAEAALIWSADKGQAELARRAAERLASAQERLRQQEEQQQEAIRQALVASPIIEELSPEDDIGDGQNR